jgi:hypothetical protein
MGRNDLTGKERYGIGIQRKVGKECMARQWKVKRRETKR